MNWKESHAWTKFASLWSPNVILDGVGMSCLSKVVDAKLHSKFIAILYQVINPCLAKFQESEVVWLPNIEEDRWTRHCWKPITSLCAYNFMWGLQVLATIYGRTTISHHVYSYVSFKNLSISLFNLYASIEKLEAFKVQVSNMCLELLHSKSLSYVQSSTSFWTPLMRVQINSNIFLIMS